MPAIDAPCYSGLRCETPRFVSPPREGGIAATITATTSEWIHPLGPPALWVGLAVVTAVALLNVPGNPVLDLNNRRYRAFAMITSHGGALLLLFGLLLHAPRWLTAVAGWTPARRRAMLTVTTVAPLVMLAVIGLLWPRYARALMREWGLIEPFQAMLYLTAAWIAARHAALLGSPAADSRPYRLLAFMCVILAIEEMDWFGIPGALLGRLGPAHVYVGSAHDLLKLTWHYHWVTLPLVSAVAVSLWTIWRWGYLTVGFIRREVADVTTLPLYGALAAQVLAQMLDVDDTRLSTRHPAFRLPLEEPLELLAGLLLVSGVLLKYCRDWRRLSRSRV